MKANLLLLSLAILIGSSTVFGQSSPLESFLLPWPQTGNWEVAHHNWDETGLDLTLLRDGESLDNWSEIGNLTFYKGYYRKGVEQIMQGMIKNAQSTYLKAKMTVVEKHTGWDTSHPWVLFTIECKDYNRTGHPQSVMYMVRKGDHYTYIAYRAIREEKISGKTKREWSDFFTSGEIVELDWTACLLESGLGGLGFLERGN